MKPPFKLVPNHSQGENQQSYLFFFQGHGKWVPRVRCQETFPWSWPQRRLPETGRQAQGPAGRSRESLRWGCNAVSRNRQSTAPKRTPEQQNTYLITHSNWEKGFYFNMKIYHNIFVSLTSQNLWTRKSSWLKILNYCSTCRAWTLISKCAVAHKVYDWCKGTHYLSYFRSMVFTVTYSTLVIFPPNMWKPGVTQFVLYLRDYVLCTRNRAWISMFSTLHKNGQYFWK